MKTKIVIAGIAGVGGYFGGLLAEHFENHPEIEIIFLARGKHLEEIKKKGLKVSKGSDSFIAKPSLATDNPNEIGKADVVIICTKTYDLEHILEQLKSCIHTNTLLLPLLNGVDSVEKIKAIFPNNVVLKGCVYIISRIKDVGCVENSGNIQKLYFGDENIESSKLKELDSFFQEARIESMFSDKISSIVWEKFIFLSPIATATSYYDKCIGEILSDEESLKMLKKLIHEVIQLAKAKEIEMLDDIVEKTIEKLKNLPFEATSSMHSDFKNRKPKTELESLTKYVITESKKYNLTTPNYSKLYEVLKVNN